MKKTIQINVMMILIVILSATASLTGILSDWGRGPFTHESVRGQSVEIYGKGLYRHMSAEVAVQGIAQDYVTLFAAIPLLLIVLIFGKRFPWQAAFIRSGVLGYFFVTYLFYLAMGTYNLLFLVYAALLALSFFALFNSLTNIPLQKVKSLVRNGWPIKATGVFLMFTSVSIALLWLSKVVPPLLNGTVYPDSLHHYTTLIVQGFDLGLLLPISFITGFLLMKRTPLGLLTGLTYIVFLSLLMTALTAKVIAVGLTGGNIVPVVFIIPFFNLVSVTLAFLSIKRTGVQHNG